MTKKNLLIELLEDSGKVSLYSPRFEGEELTEFEKFLNRHFRYEGTLHDRVMALPSHLETTSLRLYLLNIQSKILILGNGGLKTTSTYQEDDHLNKCVQTLQKIDIELKQLERKNILTIKGTQIIGPLLLEIND